MKQLFIILVTIVSSIFTQANANETGTNPDAVAAFERRFNDAREVRWEDFGTIHKVSFQHKGLYATAFYDAEGNFVAMTRNVSVTELPSALKSGIKKHMKGSWITELVHSISNDEKAYYVTFENTSHKIIMKSVNNRKWIVYQVIEK